jgi:hypothetical protein
MQAKYACHTQWRFYVGAGGTGPQMSARPPEFSVDIKISVIEFSVISIHNAADIISHLKLLLYIYAHNLICICDVILYVLIVFAWFMSYGVVVSRKLLSSQIVLTLPVSSASAERSFSTTGGRGGPIWSGPLPPTRFRRSGPPS